MQLDNMLKQLMQTCADTQDGLWLAAAHARNPELGSIFQDAATEWNAFADKIFAVLLRVDHTSPDAKWKANPNRPWLNNYEEIEAMDDRRLCMECMHGLDLAQAELRKAMTAGHPQVRSAVEQQLADSAEQMASLQPFITHGLGRGSISRHSADSPGGDPSIH
jgi:hypothetical protein